MPVMFGMKEEDATRIVLFAGRDNEIPNGICSLCRRLIEREPNQRIGYDVNMGMGNSLDWDFWDTPFAANFSNLS